MAENYRSFRVHVVHEDGRQGVVERLVTNIPKDASDTDIEQYVRDLWAVQYPRETYPKGGIEIVGDDEPRPTPTPGMFPRGVGIPE